MQGLHEDLERQCSGARPSDRSFGWVLSILFFLLAIAHGRAWAIVLGGIFALIALLSPAWLRPLHELWLAAGRALGKVTTPVVLALFYFLFITPIGALKRMFGRKETDRMALERLPGAATYWVRRDPSGGGPDQMKHTF